MKRTPFLVIGGAAALAATAVAALGPASAPGWVEPSGSGGAFLVGKFVEETRTAVDNTREPAVGVPTREIPPSTSTPEPIATRPKEESSLVPEPTRPLPPKATEEPAKAPSLEPIPPKPMANESPVSAPKEDTPRLVPKPALANESPATPKPEATQPPATLGTANSNVAPAARDTVSR